MGRPKTKIDYTGRSNNFNAGKKVIFVFGSNLAGIHGAGSAKKAHKEFGAQMGIGEGRTGDAYALPTKDEKLRTLPFGKIRLAVERFKAYAHANSDLSFVLVRIGCGLAGYSEEEISPLFKDAPDNVTKPLGW